MRVPKYKAERFGEIWEVVEIDFESKAVLLHNMLYSPLIEKFKNITLLECTGLKDKHDKEICEGDIVKLKFVTSVLPEQIEEKVGLVYWAEGDACFAIHWDECDISFGNIPWRSLEIIGNKVENPEILEIKKGLKQSVEGKVRSLGSFPQYLNNEEENNNEQ